MPLKHIRGLSSRASKSFAQGAGIKAEEIESVTMLGIDGPLEWKQDYRGLHITMPKRRPCDCAYTFKLKLKK